MTRQIVLDTETTGLNPKLGNRILEIGCVELVNRKLTGNNFHHYINPERDSEEGALAVHGLTTDFLSDKPKFADIIHDLVAYLKEADIIIHNAPFDVGFLDAEFTRQQLPPFRDHVGQIIDTLVQAKELHPGKRNSLDALCDRYEVSNTHRQLHGALLDAELLADVFLAMSRGQNSFGIEDDEEKSLGFATDVPDNFSMPAILIQYAHQDELNAHDAVLAGVAKEIKGESLWQKNAGK